VWSELGVAWRVRSGVEDREMSGLCKGAKCPIGGGQFAPGFDCDGIE